MPSNLDQDRKIIRSVPFNRVQDIKNQLEWAMKSCEEAKYFCPAYQWLRAWKRDISRIKELE